MSNTVVYYGNNAFRFFIDPYSISWTYSLNTKSEDTLGGKVIQILSCNIDNLSITGVCGSGGYNELYRTGEFFRSLLLWQRDQKQIAKFVYEPRGYQFLVVGETFTIEDKLTNLSYPFSMSFKVQEDISGLATTSSIAQELADISDGIGYKQSQFNMSGDLGVGDPVVAQQSGQTGPATITTGPSNSPGGYTTDNKTYTTPSGTKYI